MSAMKRLTLEQYRVLLKRITEALDKAKYFPPTVGGYDGPERVAEEVLRPYAPKKD
jgi:hypothetical protein